MSYYPYPRAAAGYRSAPTTVRRAAHYEVPLAHVSHGYESAGYNPAPVPSVSAVDLGPQVRSLLGHFESLNVQVRQLVADVALLKSRVTGSHPTTSLTTAFDTAASDFDRRISVLEDVLLGPQSDGSELSSPVPSLSVTVVDKTA